MSARAMRIPILGLVLALASCGGNGTSAGDDGLLPDPAATDPGPTPADESTADAPREDAPAPADVLLPDEGVPQDPGPGPDADALPDAAPDVPEPFDPGPADPGPTAVDYGFDVGDLAHYILPPEAFCPPPADACAPAEPDPAVRAMFRRDAFLSKGLYNEAFADSPVNGKRFHIAGIATAAGDIQDVRIDGVPVADLLVKPKMEWSLVWPAKAVVGEPVWVMFHTHDSKWNTAALGHVTVTTPNGNALDADFPVAESRVQLTYVTTTTDLRTVVIHLRNTEGVPRTAKRLLLNGRDVTAAACIPSLTIPPTTTVMWTVPLCEPATPGAPWTVVVEADGARDAVGVGRFLKPQFPVETWSNSDDCPFPNADVANYQKHQAAGLDTHMLYLSGGAGKDADCRDYSAAELIDTLLPGSPLKVLVDRGGIGPGTFQTTEAVAGILTGDESDGEIWIDNGTVPKPADKARTTLSMWKMYPDVPIYNGAKTNNHVGSFAGSCDVQGIDFYAAACAPHITAWGTHPPLRGPYDYLRNARNNQMPLPTWLYAQGLSPAWNKEVPLIGTQIHVQPDPQEITAQAWMVALAGGKGLMWFQTNMEEADHKPERWAAISAANWMYRGVREYLREGDITGAATADAGVLVDAIRARDALVIPVVNVDTASGPTDIGCGAGSLISEGTVPHWKLKAVAPTVKVTVPADFGIADLFEVVDGGLQEIGFNTTIDGRVVTLGPFTLSHENPARVLVLARTGAVRAAVLQGMAH